MLHYNNIITYDNYLNNNSSNNKLSTNDTVIGVMLVQHDQHWFDS